MIRTDVKLRTEIKSHPIIGTPYLVIRLTGDNPCWSIEGEIAIKGFTAEQLEQVEDEFTRRLHGRCVLSLGPGETGKLFECNPGKELQNFSRSWGLTEDDWITLTGLTQNTVSTALRGERKLRGHTKAIFTSTMSRITQSPSPGEYLRYRRINSKRLLPEVATQVGVDPECLFRWEHDLEPIPESKRMLLEKVLGLNSMIWNTGTANGASLVDVTITTPPPWGSCQFSEEIEEGGLEMVDNYAGAETR